MARLHPPLTRLVVAISDVIGRMRKLQAPKVACTKSQGDLSDQENHRDSSDQEPG